MIKCLTYTFTDKSFIEILRKQVTFQWINGPQCEIIKVNLNPKSGQKKHSLCLLKDKMVKSHKQMLLFAQELSILVTQTYTHSTACSFLQASHLPLFMKQIRGYRAVRFYGRWKGKRVGRWCRQYSPSSKGANGRLVKPAFEEKRQESI